MSTPPSSTIHDGTAPDPEELDTRTDEEIDVPLPEKVTRDVDAIDDGPDDEELLQKWKGQADENDDQPGDDKEDLRHGDEGIDDPLLND